MQSNFTVVVTGPAGNIGSTLIFLLFNQNVFGIDKRITLRLIDLPETKEKLEGLKLELEDCLFENLVDVQIREEVRESFEDADCVLFVAGKPRLIGMDRRSLLETNAHLFKKLAILCNDVAKPTTKFLIIANPCNTNALVFSKFAPKIDKKNITALSMLDHFRAKLFVCKELKVSTSRVKNVLVYGNHSSSLFVDVNEAQLCSENQELRTTESIYEKLTTEFVENKLQKLVHKRGGEIIQSKGSSSSYSAAQAIVYHLQCLYLGCENEMVSMAVYQETVLNEKVETWVSMPVQCQALEYQVYDVNLKNKKQSDIDKIMTSVHTLLDEKQCAFELFGIEK